MQIGTEIETIEIKPEEVPEYDTPDPEPAEIEEADVEADRERESVPA